MSGTYRDLRVWQSAIELTVNIYRVTGKFPAHELYGLSSQIRRAAVSVASNVAEGKGRSSDKELLQFLSRARGSCYELQTQLEIAASLGYLPRAVFQQLLQQADSVGRMLNGMIAKFRQLIADRAA
jgi:four helix bundle protein